MTGFSAVAACGLMRIDADDDHRYGFDFAGVDVGFRGGQSDF